DLVHAIWANTASDDVRWLSLHFLTAIQGKLVATLGTSHQLLVAPERLGHRAGGNDERFCCEGFQEQHEHDHEHDGFHDLPPGVLRLGRWRFRSWRRRSHGRFLSSRRAIRAQRTRRGSDGFRSGTKSILRPGYPTR